MKKEWLNCIFEKSLKRLALLMVTFVLVACGGNDASDKDYLTKAKLALDSNEVRAAIIYLKNSLKENSKNAEARWLLGQVYLEVGVGEAAEKELRKAVDLGVAGEQIAVDMVNALLMQSQYSEAIEAADKYNKGSTAGSELLQILKADALLGKGKVSEAKKLYISLLDSGKSYVGKYIGLAKIAYFEKDLKKSNEYLEQAASVDKNSVDLMFAKAELAVSQSNYSVAETVYSDIVEREQARKISRNLFKGLIGLVISQVAQDKINEVKPNVVKLEMMDKNSTLLKYIKGIISFKEGTYSEAQTYLLEVVKVNAKFSPALLLLATSNFALANYEQTAEQLTQYLALNPGHAQAGKLLAATQIRLNQPGEAVASLNSITDRSTEDLDLISLMGQAVLQSGDMNRGQRLLEQAAKAGDKRSQLQLASVYMQEGEVNKALAELEKGEGEGASFGQKALVVRAHLQNKDFGKAEKVAKQIINDNPDDARAYSLLGTVYLFKNEISKAKQQYDIALEKNPKFIVAWKNLASIHMSEKNYSAATKVFNEVLKIDKNDIDALMGLANISNRQGRPDDAIALLMRARNADKMAEKPRITLGRYYVKKGMMKEAREIESELAEYPNQSKDALVFRSALLFTVGDKRSIDVYKQLVSLDAQNYLLHYRYGLALSKFGHDSAALDAVRKSFSLNSDYMPSSSLLVSLEAKAGNFSKANKVIGHIRQKNKKSPAADSLAGDVAMIKKDYSSAEKAYSSAFEKVKTSSLLLKLTGALDKAGKHEEALAKITAWLSANPKDQSVKIYYANYLRKSGKVSQSIAEYEKLLSENSNNVAVMNDLANIMYDSGDKSEGKKLAEKAYALAPNVAQVIDTLGWILFRDGDLDKSLALFQKASNMAPNLYEIKYHLAEALVKTNQREQARNILTKIVKDGGFESEEAARKLLESLK